RCPSYLSILRLDLEALLRGRVEGDELCEVAGLGPVPISTARDLLGESILKLVVTKGDDVANVTHLGRGPKVAQKIALLWQSPCCSVEGCTRTRIEFDHREPWASTKHTKLDELDPLCSFHHHPETPRRLGARRRDRQTREGAARSSRPSQEPAEARHELTGWRVTTCAGPSRRSGRGSRSGRRKRRTATDASRRVPRRARPGSRRPAAKAVGRRRRRHGA